MRQGSKEHHWFDADGNPEGGHSIGTGYTIAWQRGPLGRGEDRKEPNGAFVEDVIASCLARIDYYQSSRFKSPYHATALDHLHAALASLNARTQDREQRDVEGTHAK
jgi:hypothetical protein